MNEKEKGGANMSGGKRNHDKVVRLSAVAQRILWLDDLLKRRSPE